VNDDNATCTGDAPNPMTAQLYDENDQMVTRRDFTKNVARFGFILATMVLLGMKTVNEAAAITCSCGPTTYTMASCEQIYCVDGMHNTGRAKQQVWRRLPQGSGGLCGAKCSYYIYYCNTGLCPQHCSGYC